MKNIPKAGEAIKTKLYVHLKDDGEIGVMDYDASNFTYPLTLLGTVEIEFNMPDYGDVIKRQVMKIAREIEQLDSDRLAAREKLENKIQQLLAIGHDGGVA